MELDFSFTLVKSAPVKHSRRNKNKQDSVICETVAANLYNKCTSSLSLTRKKRYLNSMNDNKVLNENQGKVIENGQCEFLKHDYIGKSPLSDIIDRSLDKIVCDIQSESAASKVVKDTIRYSYKIDKGDKENLIPVEKEVFVMNTNGSLKKASEISDPDVSTNLCTNNLSFNKKNCSSSSVEAAEYVELKKVSIRRHQFDTYKNCIRNNKLYFKKNKNIKDNSNSSDSDVASCVSKDIFASSLTSLNDETNSKILENRRVSVLKETSLRKSYSLSDCKNFLYDVNSSNNVQSSVPAQVSENSLKLSASRNGDSPSKGIKRSITVACNGFKRSEKSLNTSESVQFRSCSKSKGHRFHGDVDFTAEDNNVSFKSVPFGTSDGINNQSIINEDKNISLLDNSRLSGVASLLSDSVNSSVISASYSKPFVNNYCSKNKSTHNKQRVLLESKKRLTKLENISRDMFNSSVSTLPEKSICSVANEMNKDHSIDKSCTKVTLFKSNPDIDNGVNSVCKSNLKTLKNLSLNSSMDFKNSIVDSSTPRSILKCSYRKSSKNRVKHNSESKFDENEEQEKQNVPLSFPLLSYESPLLSKSKVKDITKWLAETEKCKDKNPFQTINSNSEEDLSVSPPLINKKLKSSHALTTIGSESKIKSVDLKTPQPEKVMDRIRKPLTEPNKVNTAAKKTRSVQKKSSTKKEKKKLVFSSDSDKMDHPASRILDQLYGQSWRGVTTLPFSEPRNQRQKPAAATPLPMTERKNNHKTGMFSSSSSSDDHFEEFLEKTRLKRLGLSEKRSQLSNVCESSFIDKTFSDDNSITSYQKIIASDIKKEIDILSDSKWSGNSRISSRISEKHTRRLSFSSTKGSEDANKSNISLKNNKKIKKKSTDKITRKRIPINSSHHSSDNSGVKKSKKVGKNKIQKKLKTDDDKDVNKDVEKILLTDLSEKNINYSAPNTVVKNIVEPVTPKLLKNTSEKLPGTANKLVTPGGKSNTAVPSTPRHLLSFLSSLSVVTANLRCHPDALIYKKNYKVKKEELSRKLFTLYNKEVFESKLPDDMLLQWNGRMRSTSGFCYNRRLVKNNGEVQRSSRIVLSTKILDTPDRLRDTLIHEMCHAATWIIDGVSDGHGPRWKYWATKAMQRFPELPRIKRCHDYDIKTKYTYRCTKCGYSFGRHSKSLDTERKRCGYCYGKFELLVSVKGKPAGNGRGSATPLSSVYSDSTNRTPRPVTGFALFVKQNYGDVKKSNSALPHKDVMKLLSQKFSEFKCSQSNNKELLCEN